MSHINLPEGFPGITAGFGFRPETAKPMRELAPQMGKHLAEQGYIKSSIRQPVIAS